MAEKTLTYDFDKYKVLLKQKYIEDLIPIVHQIINNIDDLLSTPNKTCQSINGLTNYYIFLNFITKFLKKNEEFFNLRDNVKELGDEIDALKNFEKNLFKFLKAEMIKDLFVLYPQNEQIRHKKDENFSYTSTFLRLLEYIKTPILNMTIKHFCITNFYNILENIETKEKLSINGKKLINLMNFLEEFMKINKSTKQKSIGSCSKDFDILKKFLDSFSLILFGNKDLINIYEVYLENLNILRFKDAINIKDLQDSCDLNLIKEMKSNYTFCYEIDKLTYEKILNQFIKELTNIDSTDFMKEEAYLNILVHIENYEITKLYIKREFSYIHKYLVNINKQENTKGSISDQEDINTPYNFELFKLIDDYFKRPSSQLIFKYLNRDRLRTTKYFDNKSINKLYIKVYTGSFEQIFKILNLSCNRLTKKLEYSIIQKELETYYGGLGDIIYSLNRKYRE